MTAIQSTSSPSTSNSLLVRACDGDAMAWQRMVQIYGPTVYNWARRTGLQPQDAADVTQETFAAISTRLPQFQSDRPRDSFRGWLWTITRNKAVDFVRARDCQPIARGGSINQAFFRDYCDQQSQNADGEPSFGDSAAMDERNDQPAIIHRALAIMRDSFETKTWRAFWRLVIDGCSPDDVASELGMSRWSVYKARARVLQRLRSELAGLEHN